ncbi:hypothetical protein SELMODRAFT_411334 [Selaginella moellendorffii]|uniref:Protein kinase domain-containing protein n=1 Tax=Selaginella moellendorffii TaxID=88036 RepID=D8RHB4_SELML|nr:hypothetical protein SELMODRAFT_411334 [Selaginella moellendorffii]
MGKFSLREAARVCLPDVRVDPVQEDSSCFSSTHVQLEPWPQFREDLEAFINGLDNTEKRLSTFFRQRYVPVASEESIMHALNFIAFPLVEEMAKQLRIPFRYRHGDGRSYSFATQVVVDTSVASSSFLCEGATRSEPSGVHGVGHIVDPWNVELTQVGTGDRKVEYRVQRLFGCMVLDEARVGYISSYHQTVFFRRPDATSKRLQFSPVFGREGATVGAFVFLLHGLSREPELRMDRKLVPFASTRGSTLLGIRPMPRGGHARLQVVDACRLGDMSAPSIEELGLTGRVAGLARFGNVLEGCFKSTGIRIVFKTFDLREEGAAEAFEQEQKAYVAMQDLYGVYTATFYGVGRLPHFNAVYLALSDEGTRKLGDDRVTRHTVAALRLGLNQIHARGVLHGDLKRSNMMIARDGGPRFLDFDCSKMRPKRWEMQEEMEQVQELLEEPIDMTKFWKAWLKAGGLPNKPLLSSNHDLHKREWYCRLVI